MKFKIKKNILQEKLNDVSKAISSKNIIPILSGIKFELLKNKLILTASDNDISIQTEINVEKDKLIIASTGSIIIKGRYILDIVKKLETDYINIEVTDDNKILVYTENSEFNLNGINVKEYPVIDLELTKEPIIIPKSKFIKLITQTNYATSNDESRVILTGVNLKNNNDYIESTATDSYRLALKKEKINNIFEQQMNIVIPNKNLLELLKILKDDEKNIEIHLFNNKVIFKFDDLLFQSRLINGTYPNTINLIPEEKLFNICVNKNEFYNIIDRASILNNDKDNNVVTLEINNEKLKVTSISLEVGKVEEKMNINCNEKLKISFSSKYMMEALKTINTENVIIYFIGEIKPIILKEENSDDLIQLILPIRTY